MFFSYFTLWCFNSFSYDLNSLSSIVLCFRIKSSHVQVDLRFEHNVFFFFSWALAKFHLPTCEVTILFMDCSTEVAEVFCFLPISVVGRIFKKILLRFVFDNFLLGVILESSSEVFNFTIAFDGSLLSLKLYFMKRRCIVMLIVIKIFRLIWPSFYSFAYII